jgi:glycosyltransferase involved in cell wall biosynthesis
MLKRLIESHQGSKNYRHAVISLTDIGEVGKQIKILGVEVNSLLMRSPLDIPRALWRLIKLLRNAKPNIVQTWMYHADLLGGLAARLSGNRYVIWGVRTTDVSAGGSRSTSVVRRVCSWLSHWVPCTIVCAAEASRQMHITLGYDAARMVVVPNGFDMKRLVATSEQRRELRHQLGFQDKELVVGSLGRFNPVKDQESFVKAAGILAQLHPNIRFMMVGRNLDTNNTELMRWILETGYTDRFVLLGERSDVPVCLSVMDIFCLHSRTEGFPNSLGEAMAMGLPCVATDVGDAALLLGNGGLIVTKEDYEALAFGLEKLLLLSNQERSTLGQKGKQRVHDEFMMSRTRERFELIYNNILKKGGC